MNIQFDNIPPEMKAINNWVCWRYEERNGKETKIPYNPKSGSMAKSNSPKTWVNYDDAVTAFSGGSYDGIGFEFGNSPFVGIDIDHCIEGGVVNKEAQKIIDDFTGYVELSPSGAGVHIIVKADIADGKGRRKGNIETYPAGRFFTVTGNVIPGYKKISTEGKALQALIAIVDAKTPLQELPQNPLIDPPEMLDSELINKIRQSGQGAKFEALYDRGDLSAYGGDDSAADQALMNILAWWTNGDMLAMERMFTSSALGKREKWANRQDYRDRTIQEAIRGMNGNGYDPVKYKEQKQLDKMKADAENPYVFKSMEWPATTIDSNGNVRPITASWKNLSYLLERMGVTVKYNRVNKKVEINGLNISKCSNEAVALLLLGIAHENGLKISKDNTFSFLAAIADMNQYSPVCDFLEEAQKAYNGKQDYIRDMWANFELDPESGQDPDFCFFLFKLWLISAVRMAFNKGAEAAQGVLVLVGAQGIGKTRFLYMLLPFKEWGAEGVSIDPQVKDDVIKSTGFWIVELGEFGETLKKEKLDRLKQFFTASRDIYRKPFHREPVDEPRRTVFIGTVNGDGFLKDRTGDRRYWVIAVKAIGNNPVDLKQFWGQVMHLAFVKKERHYLNTEEIQKLNRQNEPFKKITSEEEAIRNRLDWDSPPESWRWITPTELCAEIGLNIARNALMGKALRTMADQDERIKLNRTERSMEYFLPKVRSRYIFCE